MKLFDPSILNTEESSTVQEPPVVTPTPNNPTPSHEDIVPDLHHVEPTIDLETDAFGGLVSIEDIDESGERKTLPELAEETMQFVSTLIGKPAVAEEANPDDEGKNRKVKSPDRFMFVKDVNNVRFIIGSTKEQEKSPLYSVMIHTLAQATPGMNIDIVYAGYNPYSSEDIIELYTAINMTEATVKVHFCSSFYWFDLMLLASKAEVFINTGIIVSPIIDYGVGALDNIKLGLEEAIKYFDIIKDILKEEGILTDEELKAVIDNNTKIYISLDDIKSRI